MLTNSEAQIPFQISWVYTEDIDSTAKFYSRVLQFDCLRETRDVRIFHTALQAAIGVCHCFDDRVVEPKGGMISLVTTDVDAWHARLLRNGAQIDEPPRRLERFGIYRFALRDPNGYWLEFQQFDDSSWLSPT